VLLQTVKLPDDETGPTGPLLEPPHPASKAPARIATRIEINAMPELDSMPQLDSSRKLSHMNFVLVNWNFFFEPPISRRFVD
jgi:hypothetical protein